MWKTLRLRTCSSIIWIGFVHSTVLWRYSSLLSRASSTSKWFSLLALISFPQHTRIPIARTSSLKKSLWAVPLLLWRFLPHKVVFPFLILPRDFYWLMIGSQDWSSCHLYIFKYFFSLTLSSQCYKSFSILPLISWYYLQIVFFPSKFYCLFSLSLLGIIFFFLIYSRALIRSSMRTPETRNQESPTDKNQRKFKRKEKMYLSLK